MVADGSRGFNRERARVFYGRFFAPSVPKWRLAERTIGEKENNENDLTLSLRTFVFMVHERVARERVCWRKKT